MPVAARIATTSRGLPRGLDDDPVELLVGDELVLVPSHERARAGRSSSAVMRVRGARGRGCGSISARTS